MAYSRPELTHNPATGTIAPASWGDAVNTAADYLAINKPHCRVYNSAAISVANNTQQALTFNSERYDIGGCHSTATDTSRLTAPAGEAGKYAMGGSIEFAANTTGQRQIGIRLNGTTFIAANNGDTATTGALLLSVSTDYALAAGDYVELMAFQTSGGALNVSAAGNYSPEFWFRWVAV